MSIKLGVIGCGAIAQRRHLPEAVANPDVTVVAVADPKPGRAKEIGDKFGARFAFEDWRKVIDADVDAVAVCTPNAMHAEHTLAALAAGKHVLVEKPMATTLADAQAMVAAADKSGKFLMVGQNQRLMGAHVKAKQILDRGELGRVLAFRTAFKHPGPDGWSVDGAASWFFKPEQAVMGVTGDLGVHKIDLMRWMLGQEITEIGGQIATVDKIDPATGQLIALDDNAFLTCRTSGGAVGAILISWTNYGRGFEDNWTVLYCERGVLSIGNTPGYGVVVNYRNGGQELHKVGEIASNTNQVGSGIMDMFVTSIKTGTPPAIDGREGLASVKVILTAMRAAKEGRTLKVE
jgi:predicted dehydrogenase